MPFPNCRDRPVGGVGWEGAERVASTRSCRQEPVTGASMQVSPEVRSDIWRGFGGGCERDGYVEQGHSLLMWCLNTRALRPSLSGRQKHRGTAPIPRPCQRLEIYLCNVVMQCQGGASEATRVPAVVVSPTQLRRADPHRLAVILPQLPSKECLLIFFAPTLIGWMDVA